MRAVDVTDRTLVDRASNGDSEAFDSLFVRHRDAVARTVYLVVGDVDTAQDLAQEAFGIGFRDLGRLRNRDLFRSWVTGIALNRARRRWRRRETPMEAVVPATSAGDPDDRLAVLAALRSLPPAQRAVLVLRFYADLDEAEIAESLGIAPGTVKSRMARARTRLVAALEVTDG